MEDMVQNHMQRKRASPISTRTTITIICASCAAVAVNSLLLSIWLYRRYRRLQQARSSSKGDYKQLQKRSSISLSPQPCIKHIFSSTTPESSRRHSSVPTTEFWKQDPSDSEAQHNGQYRHSQDPAQPEQNAGPSRVYPLRPEHVSNAVSASPNARVSSRLGTSNSDASPLAPAPASNDNDDPTAPTRNISPRVKTHHTDAENSTRTIDDAGQTLVANGSLPPPPIPRKSSRRGPEPTSIDGRLAASMRREAGASVSR